MEGDQKSKELYFVTNHPKPIQSFWPRRAGVNYFEGEPKSTDTFSQNELRERGIIGIYSDVPREETRIHRLVWSQKELAKFGAGCK